MAEAFQYCDHDTRQQKTGEWAGQQDQNLAPGRAIAVVARREAAEAVQRDPGVPAEPALQARVSEFMNQDGEKYDANPNEDIDRISVLAAHSEKHRCDPKKWVHSNRDAEQPEMEVALRG